MTKMRLKLCFGPTLMPTEIFEALHRTVLIAMYFEADLAGAENDFIPYMNDDNYFEFMSDKEYSLNDEIQNRLISELKVISKLNPKLLYYIDFEQSNYNKSIRAYIKNGHSYSVNAAFPDFDTTLLS